MYISQAFVRSVMGKMTPRQIFLPVQFSSVTVIPPMRHVNLRLNNNNLIRKTSRLCLKNSTLSKI
jgi:hypothetical protein